MAKTALTLRAAMPMTLALLLTACAQPLHVIAPPPEPLRIPALPPQARQPAMPSICFPTCSAGLTKLRENWRKHLISPTPQASPASVPPTRLPVQHRSRIWKARRGEMAVLLSPGTPIGLGNEFFQMSHRDFHGVVAEPASAHIWR